MRPRPRQAQPKCVSRICPTFMRLGTPSGLSTTSTCVPSSRNGMSSTRHDHRHDALVAVAAGHLVARLDLALHGDEDLDHLHDAGRQLVAALQLVDLVDEAPLQALLGVLVLLVDGLDLALRLLVLEAELPPLAARDVVQDLLGDVRALARASWDPWRLPCRAGPPSDAHRRCGRGSASRRRGPWRDARSPRARSPWRARPSRRRGD